MFPALSINDPPALSLVPAARRKLSPAAPNTMEVAKPPYCQSLSNLDEGTRDSSILWETLAGLIADSDVALRTAVSSSVYVFV